MYLEEPLPSIDKPVRMERSTTRSHATSHARDEARHPLAKACDQCHRCKVGCNGGRPTCDRCAMNGSVCTYSTGKPIGKPKGSKNRNKFEIQRTAANKVDSVPSAQQPLASNSSNNSVNKRKTTAGASPAGTHPLDNHKRHRSSISLPSPTFSNCTMSGFVGESDLSSGTLISSVHPLEQLELHAGHTGTIYSAPTPEFLKLHVSSTDASGEDIDLTFDHDIDCGQDWSINMINDAQHKTTIDAILPSLEQTSFTPLPIVGGAQHDSNESTSTKILGENLQDANQTGCECTCTVESLAIIPKLQQYSTGCIRLSVDGVLRLTRRGTSAISNHFDCTHHNARTNSSHTCLLACMLILMQVAACYAFLRSSLEDPEYLNQFSVSVNGLHIEEDEIRRHVVNTILDAEVRKAITLSTRLEALTTNALPCEPLFSFVRQELERALERRK